jgi:hypothetical protein
MNTLYVSVSHHVHNDPRSSFTSHTKGTIDPFQSLKTAGTYKPLNSIYYGLPPASPPTGIHKVRPRYKKCKKKINFLYWLEENANTYLLTPRCRVLLEKLTGLQLVKKFPAFHGTRRFITALTSFRHLSLSWPAQSSPYTHIPPPGDPSQYYPPIYT